MSSRGKASEAAGLRPLRVLGLMSGTSLDGVDGALCRCWPDRVELERHWSARFPVGLRERLQRLAAGRGSSWELARTHHDLGRCYARLARRWLTGERVDAVGLHGQTVFHEAAGARKATLQLGEPAYLAEAVACPVVANFRPADLAAGGQGAPLATLFHRVAFARRGECVAVNNLGGISNVTWLDWTAGGDAPEVRAFDTGPANLLLNLAVAQFTDGRQECDRDGRLARRGVVDETALARWLRHPFLRRPPPKSTGREEFGEAFLRRANRGSARETEAGRCDLLATLAEFTAASLAGSYRRFLPHLPGRVILAGGGVANADLVRRITRRLTALSPGLAVRSCAEAGWPVQTVEAAAFALLAAYRLWELPANLPATTGARRPVLLGQISQARPAGVPGSG
jgi:anhydro-N-acetylmuramic acid kinase